VTRRSPTPMELSHRHCSREHRLRQCSPPSTRASRPTTPSSRLQTPSKRLSRKPNLLRCSRTMVRFIARSFAQPCHDRRDRPRSARHLTSPFASLAGASIKIETASVSGDVTHRATRKVRPMDNPLDLADPGTVQARAARLVSVRETDRVMRRVVSAAAGRRGVVIAARDQVAGRAVSADGKRSRSFQTHPTTSAERPPAPRGLESDNARAMRRRSLLYLSAGLICRSRSFI
jgi:hypothetical protein